MKKLYEYAVILQESERGAGGEEILVAPTTVLAKDPSEVNIIASRAIPEGQVGNLERITLAVRPFLRPF